MYACSHLLRDLHSTATVLARSHTQYMASWYSIDRDCNGYVRVGSVQLLCSVNCTADYLRLQWMRGTLPWPLISMEAHVRLCSLCSICALAATMHVPR
jgi:hypothetical protein